MKSLSQGINIGSGNGIVGGAAGNGGALGGTVASLGSLVGGTGQPNTNSGLTAPLTVAGAALGKVVTPVVGGVSSVTQQVGAATKLDTPVNAALNQVGGVVSGLGTQVAAGSNNPVIKQVGNTVNTVGQTVGALGGLVKGATTGTGSTGGLGGLLGGLGAGVAANGGASGGLTGGLLNRK
ncbi:collagen-like triple helix repeat-containing protein [Pseudomonas sp. S9]|uniref:collagen-like triple helix repeat-containing protein n=1 Tax=Pseudomonas sp. S9 TaxID=686578 RepID=UPI00030F8BA2|nr:collagen-like triple helix repeat-containing protein [Pseudomonas sp. S9]